MRTCKRGHVVNGENAYVNANGYASCRACLRWHAQNTRDRATAYKREAAAFFSECRPCGECLECGPIDSTTWDDIN